MNPVEHLSFLSDFPDRLQTLVAQTMTSLQCWYEAWGGSVAVQFSGGKDSTVLAHIARYLYPNIPLVFANTGLEYPEVVKFARSYSGLIEVRPKRSFKWVVENVGYPVVSKKTAKDIWRFQNPSSRNEKSRNLALTGVTSNGFKCKSFLLPQKWRFLIDAPFSVSARCCDILKKEPLSRVARETGLQPIVAIMASDSDTRGRALYGSPCNVYDSRHPISRPMRDWTEQDVLRFLKIRNIPIADVYGDIIERSDGTLHTTGADRTGCMFCMFGVHLEKTPNRFQRMEKTHPKHHKACIQNLGCGRVLDFMGIPYKQKQLSLFDFYGQKPNKEPNNEKRESTQSASTP